MSDICILCTKYIVKINEKHRVEGRGAFKILPEIESLPFPVEKKRPFVCVVCVNKLKKRRNLIRQVSEIEQYYKDPGIKIQLNTEPLSSVRTATPPPYTCSSPSRVK